MKMSLKKHNFFYLYVVREAIRQSTPRFSDIYPNRFLESSMKRFCNENEDIVEKMREFSVDFDSLELICSGIDGHRWASIENYVKEMKKMCTVNRGLMTYVMREPRFPPGEIVNIPGGDYERDKGIGAIVLGNVHQFKLIPYRYKLYVEAETFVSLLVLPLSYRGFEEGICKEGDIMLMKNAY